MTNQKGNPNTSVLKEQLNTISRILVWDDQHQGDLFEYVYSYIDISVRSKCYRLF